MSLHHYRMELKTLFYTLAGMDGGLTLAELADGVEEALNEQADDWGFTVAEMRTVFAPASFYGDAGDFDSDGKLSWAEFYTQLAGLQ